MPRKKITKSKKKDKVGGSLKADIYNLHGEAVAKTSLPAEIFAAKVNPFLLAQAVRVYQTNQRLGTHATKTRAEVVASTRKIYRQKGTGRARHGAISAPIFRGGGIAHGPKPRDYSLNLPAKMRRQALFGALTEKLQCKEVKVLRGLKNIEAKTKKMHETLVNLKLEAGKDRILLVAPQNFQNIKLASGNIQNLSVENARLLNAYEILSCKNLIIMEESIPVLANHFFSYKKESVKTSKASPKNNPPKKINKMKKAVRNSGEKK